MSMRIGSALGGRETSASFLDIWLKHVQDLAEWLEWKLLKFGEVGRQEASDEAVQEMKEEQKKLEEINQMKEGLLPLPPEKAQPEEDADAAKEKEKSKGKGNAAVPTAPPAARAAVRTAIARYMAKH